MSGPLKGLRVLDLSRVLAGPWAGQVLADLGAEVIKVEKPGSGDDTRGWGPPYLKDRDGEDGPDAAYFISANRGKKSIAIDFTKPEGAVLVRRLAETSDILLENFKVGGLKKYGLDYASLSARHKGLIYCSITGFGQSGPEAHRAGYDFIIQGMTGLMSITGNPDGPPQKVGVAISDLSTGMYAVMAILAACVHREKTGEGQHIDMALFDTQLCWLANQNMNYLIGGAAPRRLGNAHPNIVPYQDFATADGRLIVAVGNDRQFTRFAALVGREDLAADERFMRNADRVRHRETLVPLLASALMARTTRDWQAIFDEAGIPCGPINDIAQAFAEPQVAARGLKFDLPHPRAGNVPQVANPIKYSATPLEYQAPPPLLGQHSDDILAELGLSPAEIEELRQDDVIG